MYKKSTTAIFAAIGLIAASCSSNEIIGDSDNASGSGSDAGKKEETHYVEISASDNSQTKMTYGDVSTNNKAALTWQTNDNLGLFSTDSNSKCVINSLTLSSGVGTKYGKFAGTVTGTVSKYAVYPYNGSHSLNDTAIIYNLPPAYTYTSVTAKTNSCNMPCYGEIEQTSTASSTSGSSNLSLKTTLQHIGGVFVFRVPYMPTASGKFTVASNPKISGKFTYNITNNSGSQLKAVATSDDSENYVTFSYSGAEVGKEGLFYLPVAPGTYDVQISIIGEETGGSKKVYYQTVTKSLTIAANDIKPLVISGANSAESYKTVDSSKSYVLVDSDKGLYWVYGDKDNELHEMVDLGITDASGNKTLLFATCNIGASKPEEFGDYYQWGATTPSSVANASMEGAPYQSTSSPAEANKLTWSKYTYESSTGYSPDSILQSTDDVATQKWGSAFRMPTTVELISLLKNTTVTWTTSGTTTSSSTTNGTTYTKTSGSASIFLPVPGHINVSRVKTSDTTANSLSGGGKQSGYWASGFKKANQANLLRMKIEKSGNSVAITTDDRYEAYPIRAVAAIDKTN